MNVVVRGRLAIEGRAHPDGILAGEREAGWSAQSALSRRRSPRAAVPHQRPMVVVMLTWRRRVSVVRPVPARSSAGAPPDADSAPAATNRRPRFSAGRAIKPETTSFLDSRVARTSIFRWRVLRLNFEKLCRFGCLSAAPALSFHNSA